MLESFSISKVFHAKPEKVFMSWLDSVEHSAFTGGKAVIDPVVGGKFTAWDDYISGNTIMIEKDKRIIQNWRTSDFSDNDIDSTLEILFKKYKNGTRLTINHSNLPEGQGKSYKDGWVDYYFEPMQKYFK